MRTELALAYQAHNIKAVPNVNLVVNIKRGATIDKINFLSQIYIDKWCVDSNLGFIV